MKAMQIRNMIYEIRGRQVMLDTDLAKIYQVETKVFNQAVKRNMDRFPSEFMFQLKEREYNSLRSQFAAANLRSQIVTSSWGGRRYLPFAFTEHGVIMLSSVLNSKIAKQINIAVVRAFIDMRRYITKPVHKKIDELEKILMLYIDDTNQNFTKHAEIINSILATLNNLIEKPPKTKTIGFRTGKE